MSAVLEKAAPRKVGMISLGCAKNLVDAEVMLGDAATRGYEITPHADDADVIVVNTCGFIDTAKQESIDAILEAGAKLRAGQKLVVSGCLSQRYAGELRHELPEVHAFIGLDQVAQAGHIFDRLFDDDHAESAVNLVTRGSRYIPDYTTPKFQLTPGHTAYVKIAEGCNHPCSFCVIPQMRGRHRSRTIDSIVRETRERLATGVREINLISQDTTYYGMDLWEQKASPTQPVDSRRGPTLVTLLDELGQLGQASDEFWLRLLYTHPAHWSDELIAAIARNPRVVPYIDMPLQHIHESMLGTMRRQTTRQHIEDLILRLRAGIPHLAIRTTFIVGFPGETEEQFESLLEFIERVRFERLGVFAYSREEGSRAAKMEDQIPTAIKNRRHRRAMKLQQRIASELAAAQVGRTLRVLVEQPRIARTPHDAPEVDCKVILTKDAPVGHFIDAKVTGTQVYDLVAQPL